MTRGEAILLASFMERLSERFGNDGCNDFYLENTQENCELVIAAERENDAECDGNPLVHNGKLLTMNFLVLDYLQQRFMKEHGIAQCELIHV